MGILTSVGKLSDIDMAGLDCVEVCISWDANSEIHEFQHGKHPVYIGIQTS